MRRVTEYLVLSSSIDHNSAASQLTREETNDVNA